jgi:hypothetical protein
VTSILAVTADKDLEALLRDCAGQAGVYLTVHDTVAAARKGWADAEMVLVGADQVAAAARNRLKPHGRLIVVGGDHLDPAEVAGAQTVGVVYIVVLPLGSSWLIEQLRRAGSPVLERLRAAGFTLGHADRDLALADGFVRPTGWREHADADRRHPWVLLSDVARGECPSGQAGTVVRSNMRSLHRAFPDVFTDMVFATSTALGAFVADLPPQLVDRLYELAREYLVFDEDDLAELEHQEVLDSWQQWVADDVHRGLGEHSRAVWDELDDDAREQLWWEVVTGTDAWPEHDARTVLWRLGRLVGAYAARLTAEGRRRARRARPVTA